MYTHSLFSSFVLSHSLSPSLSLLPLRLVEGLRGRGDARRQLKGAELPCHFSHNSITKSRQHAHTDTRTHMRTHAQTIKRFFLDLFLEIPLSFPFDVIHSLPVNYRHLTFIKNWLGKKKPRRFSETFTLKKIYIKKIIHKQRIMFTSNKLLNFINISLRRLKWDTAWNKLDAIFHRKAPALPLTPGEDQKHAPPATGERGAVLGKCPHPLMWPNIKLSSQNWSSPQRQLL